MCRVTARRLSLYNTVWGFPMVQLQNQLKNYQNTKKYVSEEKHVISPLMTPIVSEWLDFFSG
jgi:hypothetical protein